MQTRHWITLLWIATVAGAWFFGGQTAAPGAGGTGDVALLEENTRLRERIATLESAAEARGPALEARGSGAMTAEAGPGAAAPSEGSAKAPGTGASEEAVESIDLASIKTPAELSEAFLAYARTMLGKGRAGHLELLAWIGKLGEKENEEHFERIFAAGGERAIAGAIYPVMKFAIHNEKQVMALTETFFEQGAENPAWFEGMDDDPFELFTEGIGMIAPSIVDDKQLARMRGYAKAILAQDEKTQPKALARNRRDLERLLQLWAPPIPLEELIAKLQAGTFTEGEMMGLLPTLPPEALKHVDLDRYIGPRIEKGDWQAVNMLRRFPDMDAVTRDRLDQRVYRGAAAEKSRMHGWFVNQYLQRTGRRSWAEKRTFFETGLGLEGKAADTFAQGLMHMGREGPDKDWVRWALGRFTLSATVAKQLKTRYGIQD